LRPSLEESVEELLRPGSSSNLNALTSDEIRLLFQSPELDRLEVQSRNRIRSRGIRPQAAHGHLNGTRPSTIEGIDSLHGLSEDGLLGISTDDSASEFSGIMSMSYSDRPQLFFVIERRLIEADSRPLSEDSVEDPNSAEGYGYLILGSNQLCAFSPFLGKTIASLRHNMSLLL
jgi:hypothetical protein